MSKKYRLFLMIISIIILFTLGLKMYGNIFFITEIWCASGLLMIILLSLVDQPFFSKDSNIFVNAITAGLALLLSLKGEKDLYFYFLSFLTIYLLFSSYILMWIRSTQLKKENEFIQKISRFNRFVGKPNVLFVFFFLWGIKQKIIIERKQAIELMCFLCCFMVLNLKVVCKTICRFIPFLDSDNNSEEKVIGENFGVQSENIFLSKLYKNRRCDIKKFEMVDFIYGIDRKLHIGIVLDIYYLNEEQWIKILSIEEKEQKKDSKQNNKVYKSEIKNISNVYKDLAGIITEESTIDKIRFEYIPIKNIEAGRLLQVMINNDIIIYQVTEGITKLNVLEKKNETSKIIGEAIQLGKWNKSEKKFIKHGWVPENNTPLFLINDIEKTEIAQEEYSIGTIPETNFPVILNKEIAITHHTAIIGITGSGKSVFARNLIKQIAGNENKVIIVDITGEYLEKDNSIKTMISDENAKAIYDFISILNNEMAQYKNNRKQSVIDEATKNIKGNITQEIENFINSKQSVVVFTLPNIVNEINAIDYTKWFLLTLFNYVRANKIDKRICVVLEEAHTIVPEWNSMGVDDNSSKASVNSIAQIALQGRKYNIGFIVIAQRTANVSKTVLTQCNSIITFQELDNTTLDFLSNYMGKQYISAIPTLKPRYAIAVGKAFRSNTPMIFKVPEISE